MLRIVNAIVGAIVTLVTGGKYGSSVYTDRFNRYAKMQEQRRKDFAAHGGHPCTICGTRIPGNKSYCARCYYTYKT